MIGLSYGNFQSGVGGFVGLLDTYGGAAAAYSVRRLSSTYEGALMEVRRSSDNTVQDIGYNSNGDLDTASLLSFVGAGDGFVRTWYDQSGNSLNQIQSTASNQPQIVSSGVIETEGGKPKLLFDGVNDMFEISYSNQTIFSVFNVSKYTNTPSANEVMWSFSQLGSVEERYELRSDNSNFEYFLRSNATVPPVQTIAATNINTNLFTSIYNALQNSSYLNGSVIFENQTPLGLTGAIDFDALIIGAVKTNINVFFFDGSHQELVFYNTHQSSNRSEIESNINTYFSIY